MLPCTRNLPVGSLYHVDRADVEVWGERRHHRENQNEVS